MLNPLSFDTKEEFERALEEEGLKRGWTARVETEIDNVATHGELAVVDILSHQESENTNLVIVALPAEDDYVNKISSEQVPHMTLLFLGETGKVKNISKIVDFVEHASKGLNRFCLEVDRRGTLGPNLVDVLYFGNRKWSGFEEIRNFRSNLLKDDNTKIAYDSVEQFPEWVPHLTLGSPDAPANPDQRDFTKFYSVDFDRIAVWAGDFEGPEFNLKSWDLQDSGGYTLMSETASIVGKILTHHGVKGQKWGVRKFASKVTGDNKSKVMAPAKIERKDKKFVKRVSNPKKEFKLKIDLHNAAADACNAKHINQINSKSVYKKASRDGTLRDDNNPITKRYHKEHVDAYLKEINIAASNLPKSPSGKKEYAVAQNSSDPFGFTVYVRDVKHDNLESIELPKSFRVKFIKDTQGRITGFVLDDNEMAQSAINDILAHHGVKGQKWGVRKNKNLSKVTVIDKGKRLKTSGGEGLKADPSAVRARVIGQKAKGSGLKALTDEELKTYANRLNLEQNVKRLQFEDKPAVQKFILRLLGQTGKNSVNAASNELVVQRVRRAVSGS